MSETSNQNVASLAKGGTINLIGTAIGGISGIGLVLVVTNTFAIETAGMLFAATSLFLIVTALCELGTDAGLSHGVQRALAAGDPAKARAVLRIALGPVLALSVVLGVVGWVAAPWLGDLLSDRPEMTGMIRALVFVLPLATSYNLLLAATRAYSTMRPNVLVEKLFRLPLQIISVLAVGLAGGGPVPLALAWGLPYVPGLVAALRAYARLTMTGPATAPRAWRPIRVGSGSGAPGRARKAEGEGATRGRNGETDNAASVDSGCREPDGSRAPRPPGTAREFWAFTAPRALGRICQVALQRADIVLVAAMLGPRAAAIYTAVTKVLAVGQLCTMALQQVLQPQLSRLFATSDLEAARRVFRTATAWLMALNWPVYAGAAVAAPLVLQIFGEGFGPGRDGLIVLTLTMLVAVACGPVDTALLMAGRSRQSLGNSAAALAVDLVLIAVLVPFFGITGAAVAWAAALLVRNLLPVWQIWRAYRMLAFGAASVWVGASALLCFGVLPLAAFLVLGWSWPVLIGAAVVVSPVYAFLLLRRRDLLELGAFKPLVVRLVKSVRGALRGVLRTIAGHLVKLPLPRGLRVALSKLLLRRLRPIDVPLDRLLLGAQNNVSVQRYASAFDDLMWGSTPVAAGPHVDLLRRAAIANGRPMKDRDILESPYGEHARRCIVMSGRYFSATDDTGIVEVARSFVSPDGPPRSSGGSARSGSGDPILVAPIRDSDCYSVLDGHHRLARAVVGGKVSAKVTVKRLAVTTPLQDLLDNMSWIGGKRELYQPVDAPELKRSWTTVRRCTDRLEKMEHFLLSRGHAKTEYRKPSYLDVASCYGWFVAQFTANGFQAAGIERDPLGRDLGVAAYDLKPEQIHIGDAPALLREFVDNGQRFDVVSCFSLLHHFVLGRGGETTAEELVGLLSEVTRGVLFLDTGQEHEAWFAKTLPGWDPERVENFLRDNGDFDEVIDLGPDEDAIPPYAENYGRHLFACVRGNQAKPDTPDI